MLPGGIGQQLKEGRLVGDERTHPPGVPGDQREAGHRAAAAAEHVGGFGTEDVQQSGDVVRAQFGGGVLLGIVEDTA